MKKETGLALLLLALAAIALYLLTKDKPLPIPIAKEKITIDKNITAFRIQEPMKDKKPSDPLKLITRYQAIASEDGRLTFQNQTIPYKRSGKKIFFQLLGNHPKRLQLTLKIKRQLCFLPKEAVYSKNSHLYIFTDINQSQQIEPTFQNEKGYYIDSPCPKRIYLFKHNPLQ